MPRTKNHAARATENLADEAQSRTTIFSASDEGPREGTPEAPEEHPLGMVEVLRMLVVALAAGAVWLLGAWPSVKWIGVVALGFGGWPIFKEAAENLLARRMTMELSMTIALVSAAAISEFFTALLITLFVLGAEVLEGMTVSRGRRAIRDLLDFLPRSVTVRRLGAVSDLAADELRVGDAVLVNPGGRIPVDGTVVAGHSFVDQARITGESMPVEKVTGGLVYAGSINQTGALEVRADRIGRDTSYGRIIEAVERAEQSRAPVQRLADRLAGFLVYFALAAAALTYLLTRDARSTISVVIVAGACGVAVGTPLAILGAIGRAARLGAVVKGGLHLETLGRVNMVVFDKTGTLTLGQPEVQRVLSAADGVSPDSVLEVAAAAELRSEHPLGRAIVAKARERGVALVEPERFDYTVGRGIRASVEGGEVLVGNRSFMEEQSITLPAPASPSESIGGSEVFVARGGSYMGAVIIADSVRPEAREALEMLRRMGLETILLTGDSRPIADAVAHDLGIQNVEADLLPEDKVARVKNLVSRGRTVAVVGDGVNDAPALAEADVAVAMGSGTDVARESADIVLLGNDLVKFAATVSIARWTRRIIWQNFIGTVVVDVVGIGLAAFGLLNPVLAAFIHVSSELAFILNSTRLLPR